MLGSTRMLMDYIGHRPKHRRDQSHPICLASHDCAEDENEMVLAVKPENAVHHVRAL